MRTPSGSSAAVAHSSTPAVSVKVVCQQNRLPQRAVALQCWSSLNRGWMATCLSHSLTFRELKHSSSRCIESCENQFLTSHLLLTKGFFRERISLINAKNKHWKKQLLKFLCSQHKSKCLLVTHELSEHNASCCCCAPWLFCCYAAASIDAFQENLHSSQFCCTFHYIPLDLGQHL